MNTAFVASTLPAKFLKDEATELKIERIVCASEDLSTSYSFLKDNHKNLSIVGLPKRKIKHFFSLLSLINSSQNIYFFHECCWPLFDLGLIILQTPARWYPQVSLNGFRLVHHEELNFKNQIAFYYDNKNLTTISSVLAMTVLNRWFDVYENTSDGGDGVYRCLSLKTEKFHFIKKFEIKSDASLLVPQREITRLNYSVVVTCAREPIADNIQIELYNLICDIFSHRGYNIFVKDHPNPTSRLGFTYPGAEILAAHIPFECINLDFDFVIGVASASMGRSKQKSLSLLNLIPFTPEVIKSRMATLAALENFSNIIFIRSIAQVNEIIDIGIWP